MSRLGVSGAFDEIESEAYLYPNDIGVKAIFRVQVSEGPSVEFEHISLCLTNAPVSEPCNVIVPIVRSPIPEFENVMLTIDVLPIITALKSTMLGAEDNFG
jgi:hypothetical protein